MGTGISLHALWLEFHWVTQRRDNAQQLADHQNGGDHLEQERLVSHVATFPSRELCDRFQATLAMRYATVVTEREGGEWQLAFARIDRLATARVHSLTYALLAATVGCGGKYEGWTAPIVAKETDG